MPHPITQPGHIPTPTKATLTPYPSRCASPIRTMRRVGSNFDEDDNQTGIGALE